MSDEYDAFGRKRDEAGLGDLGWGSAGDPDAVSNPETPTPTVSAAESGFSAPQEFKTVITSGDTPRIWRPRRNPLVWVIQLAILGGIGFGIYTAVDAGNDTVNSIRDTFEAIDDVGAPGSGQGTADRGDTTVPEQVKPRDLFGSPGDLREALRIMERELPGRITNFSIHRDGIHAQIVRNDVRSIALFAPDAEAPEVVTRVEGSTASSSFSYEEINPTAASRLMQAANRRLGRAPADVDYFVVSDSAGAMQWGIYYEGGSPIALGDSRGRYTRRIA